MDPKTVKVITQAVLAIGKGKFPAGGCPSSMLMLAMGTPIDAHLALIALLEKTGFVECRGHYLTLTDRGEQAHDELLRILAESGHPIPPRPDTTQMNIVHAGAAQARQNVQEN